MTTESPYPGPPADGGYLPRWVYERDREEDRREAREARRELRDELREMREEFRQGLADLGEHVGSLEDDKIRRSGGWAAVKTIPILLSSLAALAAVVALILTATGHG